jgi:hypothetical protein
LAKKICEDEEITLFCEQQHQFWFLYKILIGLKASTNT